MKRGFLVLVLALFSLVGETAHANGRFPASNAVVFHPSDPNTIAVRVTFGLLVSKDAGASWKWICERAIGFSGVEDPTYVITPKGTIVAGTFEGATTSRDGGCDWQYIGGKGQTVLVDLTMRDDGEVLGISSVYDKAGDGKSLFNNAVLKSTNDGQSFETIVKGLDNTLLLESIEIAKTDPKRVYVSAVRGEKADRKGVLLVSSDGGATFTERDVGLIAGELAPYIAEVDPTRADRVFIRTAGSPDGPSRLLITDDAGKTFRMILASPGPLTGFALTRDGSKVYAGGKEAGVQSASTFDLGFSKIGSIETQCLGASVDKKLWACSNEKSGFIIGMSENAGLTFNPKLHIQGIEPLTCGAQTTVGKECGKEWPKLRRELGLDDAAPASSAQKEKADPGAPALKERGGRTRRGSSASGALFLVVIIGSIAYYVIKRIRRGR